MSQNVDLEQEIIQQILNETNPHQPQVDCDLAIYLTNNVAVLRIRDNTEPIAFQTKVVSPQTLQSIFQNTINDSNWLPANPGYSILRHGIGTQGFFVVLYIHPGQHTIHTPEPTFIPLPGLIFIGYNQNFYVFATKLAKGVSPEPSTVIWTAPFPNTYTDGKICFGEATLQLKTHQDIIKAWELFLAAPFSNWSTQNKCKSYPNVFDLFKTLKNKRKFPLTELSSYRGDRYEPMTLESLTQQIILPT